MTIEIRFVLAMLLSSTGAGYRCEITTPSVPKLNGEMKTARAIS